MALPSDELKTAAAEVGLNKLEGAHWEELQKALDAKERHTKGMPDGLTIWDEPAHVYRAGDEA
jgi:hypothetical protein